MDLLFFDTSALVKRYYREPGTETVDDLIEDERRVLISSLAIVETTSALQRKRNRGAIAEDDVHRLLASFFREALNDFTVLPMEESIQAFSFDLILESDLRTLDSLQLSAALSVDSEEHDVAFVCADESLTAVADARGLSTIVPS